jgi:hypothetical protein
MSWHSLRGFHKAPCTQRVDLSVWHQGLARRQKRSPALILIARYMKQVGGLMDTTASRGEHIGERVNDLEASIGDCQAAMVGERERNRSLCGMYDDRSYA